MKTWVILVSLWVVTLLVGSARWYHKYHAWPTFPPVTWKTVYITNYVDVPRQEAKIDPWMPYQPDILPVPHPMVPFGAYTNIMTTNNCFAFSNVIYMTPFAVTNRYVTNLWSFGTATNYVR